MSVMGWGGGGCVVNKTTSLCCVANSPSLGWPTITWTHTVKVIHHQLKQSDKCHTTWFFCFYILHFKSFISLRRISSMEYILSLMLLRRNTCSCYTSFIKKVNPTDMTFHCFVMILVCYCLEHNIAREINQDEK